MAQDDKYIALEKISSGYRAQNQLNQNFELIEEAINTIAASVTVTQQDITNITNITNNITNIESSVDEFAEYTEDHILQAEDANKVIQLKGETDMSLVIPSDSAVSFPVGTSVEVVQTGDGAVVISGATGVTVNTPDNYTLTRKFSAGMVRKTGANEWRLQRYWLESAPVPQPEDPDPTDPEDPTNPGTPDQNTPMGHWINNQTNEWDNEGEFLGLAAYPNVKGIVYRLELKQIETAQSTAATIDTDWSIVEDRLNALQNSSDAETKAKKMQVFIEMKSFDNQNPAPLWYNEAGLCTKYNNNGYILHWWDPTVRDRLVEIYQTVPTSVKDHPNFGGFTFQETATGQPVVVAWSAGSYDAGDIVTKGGELYIVVDGGTDSGTGPSGTSGESTSGGVTYLWNATGTTADDVDRNYTANNAEASIVSIVATMCQYQPNHHHFLFANFISGNTLGILDVVDGLTANYSNFVWASPDILPGASSLIDWNRVYGMMRSRQDTAVRFGCSCQFDSYEQDYPPTRVPAAGSYKLPPEDAGETTWSMEEMFLWGVEKLHLEWCFWNNATKPYPKRNWLTDGSAVANKYPTWTSERGAIPVAAQKDLEHPFWNSKSNIESIEKITASSEDWEESVNAFQTPNVTSWKVFDTSDLAEVDGGEGEHHNISGTIADGDYPWVVGQEYILELVGEAATQPAIRLQTRNAAGEYDTLFFDLTSGGALGEGSGTGRYHDYEKDSSVPNGPPSPKDSDYVKCQMYFTPKPTNSDAGDVVIRISSSSGTAVGDQVYIGTGSNAFNWGICRINPKVRK